jgi:hypothetical protein
MLYRKTMKIEVVEVLPNGDRLVQNEGDSSDRWIINKVLFESSYEEVLSVEDTELYEKQYEGFVITCKKCGSHKIEVSNSVGFSEISGAWGSVDLFCRNCDSYVELFNA